MKTYKSKADTIHKLFTGQNLSQQLENELMKLRIDAYNHDIDEQFIKDNMEFLMI